MKTSAALKKLIAVVTLALGACGPVSQDAAKSQLGGGSSGARQGSTNTNSSISSLQIDTRGAIDLLYTITNGGGTNLSFSIMVTRYNGTSTSRLVTLTASDDQNLATFLAGIFNQSVTITSRTTCSDCVGYTTFAFTRADSSYSSYSYPTFNSSLEDPITKLNEFVKSRL